MLSPGNNEATIYDVAGIELYVEVIKTDCFVVAANPPARSTWARAWDALPVRRPLTAKALIGLPMILPEPDAGRRKRFDSWFKRSTEKVPNVVLELGGWQSLLGFAQSGIGDAFATEEAVRSVELSRSGRHTAKPSLSVRQLGKKVFPPDQIRLIVRKQQGHVTPDLGTSAHELYQLLVDQIAS